MSIAIRKDILEGGGGLHSRYGQPGGEQTNHCLSRNRTPVIRPTASPFTDSDILEEKKANMQYKIFNCWKQKQ